MIDLTKLSQSKWLKRALIGIGLLIIILVSFGLGIAVGFHKAHFSYAWGENYDRNFGGPHHGIFGFFHENEFAEAHGTFGSIMSIGSSTLIVSSRDGIEKPVLISSSTIMRAGRDNINLSSLKINDRVVVIGNPNEQGQIEARLIRVMW